MQITEFECKKCKHSFTRLYKDKKEAKKLKEKCIRCGGEVKKLQEIKLGGPSKGCFSCAGCGKKCKK